GIDFQLRMRTPSPGTPGEGRGEGSFQFEPKKMHPLPNSLSEDTAREKASSHHHRNGKAVISLGAHGLNRRRGYALLFREDIIETTDALDVHVLTLRLDHGSFADDVVDDYDAAAARQLQRPGEIIRGRGFVGVDEDQVERAAILRGELWERVERAADDQIHDVGQTGAGDVLARDFRLP